jgi:MFS family permease
MVAAKARTIQTERIDLGRLWWASLLAGLGATVANVVVYFIAAAAGAIPQTVLVPTINNQPAPLTVLPVIINSFVPAIAAGVLLALLNRFVRRPVRLFRIIAVVLLLVSFANPLTIPGAPLMMIIALDLMHIVAAAIIVGVLTTLPVKRSAASDQG